MALGFDDYGALTIARSADIEETLLFPSSYDFTGFTGSLQIRDTITASVARLTVTEAVTANGSVITFEANIITLRIKKEDTSLLPEADPYTGFYEWTITDPDGLTTRLVIGPLVAEKGIIR